MHYDESKIDEAVLALLAVFCFEDDRTWKGYDFGVMERLHVRRLIENPTGKNKSVRLTPEGLGLGRAIAARLFDSGTKNTG